MTAGGTFLNTTGSADNEKKRHDVVDIWPGGDQTASYSTPGNTGSDIILNPSELHCAGAKGCHGNHETAMTDSDKGIKGFHHAVDGGYRSLRKNDGGGGGLGTLIDGVGFDDYEKGGATDSNHNLYKGYAGTGINDGMSALCAMCHSQFHQDGGNQKNAYGNWIQHPTDVGLPAWGIMEDPDDTPYAFKDFSGVSTSNMANYDETNPNAQVMCLSCHRAHGSPYKAILRFDYDLQLAGNTPSVTIGCLRCHTAQR